MAYGYRLVLLTAAALTSANVLAIAGVSGSVAGKISQSALDRSGAAPPIVLAQAVVDPKKKPVPAAKPAPVAKPAPAVAPKIAAPAAAPKFVNPAFGPKVVSPPNNPAFVPRNNAQRNFGSSGNAGRAVAIRGANRTVIGGRTFSVQRGNHRVFRNGSWRTFVGLGALGAIVYGGYRYYPYAYIDAPPELCEGDTEDGCQLQWQQVQTLEGPPDFQCVAYCPFQQ